MHYIHYVLFVLYNTIVSLFAASVATIEVLFHMTKTTGCEINVSDLVTRVNILWCCDRKLLRQPGCFLARLSTSLQQLPILSLPLAAVPAPYLALLKRRQILFFLLPEVGSAKNPDGSPAHQRANRQRLVDTHKARGVLVW